jgi:hypothetical protein
MTQDQEPTDNQALEDDQELAVDVLPVLSATYLIHNVSRDVRHRTHRAQAATHSKKKHFLNGGSVRVLRARPLLMSHAQLLQHLPELREKHVQHMLEVRTPDGRTVDLNTFQLAAPAPAVVLPHPKLDSAADDLQVGQYIPPYVGDDGAMPSVLAPGEKPALLQAVEDAEHIDAETAEETDEATDEEELEGEEELAGEEGTESDEETEVAEVSDPELDAALAAAQGEVATPAAAPAAPRTSTSKNKKKRKQNRGGQ